MPGHPRSMAWSAPLEKKKPGKTADRFRSPDRDSDPEGSRNPIPCPSYPEIRLTLRPKKSRQGCISQRDRSERSTSRQKAPSAWPHGAGASATACRSRPQPHRFPEYLRYCARRFRWPGPMRSCAGFIGPPGVTHPGASVPKTQRQLMAERGIANLAILARRRWIPASSIRGESAITWTCPGQSPCTWVECHRRRTSSLSRIWISPAARS